MGNERFSSSLFGIHKIISGGQNGVDRAALDFAIKKGISHGGFCPKGRIAEDGRIPDLYHLIELDSEEYSKRTKKNVISSDGTLIIYLDEIMGGTLLTYQYCEIYSKSVITLDINCCDQSLQFVFLKWLKINDIQILNIAGPRNENGPIYRQTLKMLQLLIQQ